MFESSFKLLLRILKRLNAFQELKMFSFFLGLPASFLLARLILTDVWQAIIARDTKSRKSCSKPT